MYITGNSSNRQLISTNKLVNIILIILFVVVIVLHIVSLSVVVAKNHEIVDKFDPPEHHVIAADDVCIFFIDDKHSTGAADKCHLVIYGSGALVGCVLLIITSMLIKTIRFNK